MTGQFSLAKRLLLWISVPLLVASVATVVLAFVYAWHEIEEVYDAQLVHSAKVLLQLTEVGLRENADQSPRLDGENLELQHKYEKKTAFRAWRNGALIIASQNAVNFGSEPRAPPGFSDRIIDGARWRFFVFSDTANLIRVETSERYDIRYELTWQLMLALVTPGLVFVPVIFLLVWLGVRGSLKPLVKLSADVDRRGSDDLTPIEPHALPQEVSPLVIALNRLLNRIEASFRREREFTDHAAHELRTPLAAMKTQTQVLLRKAKLTPDLREGLENLQSAIDRSTHLVQQLLALARLQNEHLPKSSVCLSRCVDDVVDQFVGLAAQKKIRLTRDIAADVTVEGHEESLTILIRNLLDNAVKYSDAGGHVHVWLSNVGVLQITDTGPGLSDQDKGRVFGRFIRADRSGQSGSGLGLSIASWIAAAHGVLIELKDNEPHGLIAELRPPEELGARQG